MRRRASVLPRSSLDTSEPPVTGRFESRIRLLLPGGECLRLELVELRLGDGSAVQQRLRARDRLRGIRAGYLADVRVGVGLCGLRPRLAALAHALTVGDQVHEDSEVREEDHEDRPARLRPAAEVVTGKQVAEYHEEKP